MNKKIVAVLALGMVATNAHASRAKNLVSGTGDGGSILGTSGMTGSFYTNDENNVFWNPSFIVGQKNSAFIEKSSPDHSNGSAGFTTEAYGMNLGVYLNQSTGVSRGSKPLNIVLGGDMGVKWGVGLTKTTAQGAGTTRVTAGAQVADFEPFAAYNLSASNGLEGTAEAKDSLMTVGTRYRFGDWTPYAAFSKSKTDTGGTISNDLTKWGLGVGHNVKAGDVRVGYALAFWRQSNATTTAKQWVVPVNMNVEADAASWFTVRAGLGHTVMERGVAAGATTARVGGTFHFGKADLDMVVGGGTSQSIDSTYFDTTNGLFSAASLNYRW